MPLYDYECGKCKHVEVDVYMPSRRYAESKEGNVSCPQCSGVMTRLFPTNFGPPNFGWPEDGITMEHCEAKPVHFKSRSDAKRYAREHNVDLGCL